MVRDFYPTKMLMINCLMIKYRSFCDLNFDGNDKRSPILHVVKVWFAEVIVCYKFYIEPPLLVIIIIPMSGLSLQLPVLNSNPTFFLSSALHL